MTQTITVTEQNTGKVIITSPLVGVTANGETIAAMMAGEYHPEAHDLKQNTLYKVQIQKDMERSVPYINSTALFISYNFVVNNQSMEPELIDMAVADNTMIFQVIS